MSRLSTIMPYWQLMRFHKPIGIYLLLWPTLWALWIANNGFPNLKILLIFVFGVVIMRAAGCVINDFADRKIDNQVTRTKNRPLTTGRITAKSALMLFFSLISLAFVAVLFTNPLTIFLAFFAAFFATLYPFCKRFTHFPQVILGIAFAFSVPMSFAASINHLPPLCWLIMLTTIIWTIAYDTQYAMTDREDDLKIGVKSTAIAFGQADRYVIGALQAMVIALLCSIGYLAHLNTGYFLSLFFVAGLFLYQQKLIWHREPRACFQAFLNNHWVGAIIFLGIFCSL